uniref:Uncharacterized protein n=1 Tax=Knipowitschia caucasica TaxID=637954 RepID=A0AAV2J5U8_KNICA
MEELSSIMFGPGLDLARGDRLEKQSLVFQTSSWCTAPTAAGVVSEKEEEKEKKKEEEEKEKEEEEEEEKEEE